VASASDLKETAAAPLAAERLPGESAVKRGADALLRGSVATTSRHIPSLNGIRAGSFLIVFGSHALGGSLIPGGLGVTVFFFLSGYLITTLMRAEYEKNATVSLRHFWLRRALRILPPLYLVVLGSVLLRWPYIRRGRCAARRWRRNCCSMRTTMMALGTCPEPASSGRSRSKSTSICSSPFFTWRRAFVL